jgi:hypothetical protein
MNRRDFFKGILAVASTAPLAIVGGGAAQVLRPPHGKKKGILTVPDRLSAKQAAILSRQWNSAVRSDKTIVLSGGMKYEEVYIGEETEIKLLRPRG